MECCIYCNGFRGPAVRYIRTWNVYACRDCDGTSKHGGGLHRDDGFLNRLRDRGVDEPLRNAHGFYVLPDE